MYTNILLFNITKTMEMEMDKKGLDKPCTCESGKPAGKCCRKDESCYCGSKDKVSECCMKEEVKK